VCVFCCEMMRCGMLLFAFLIVHHQKVIHEGKMRERKFVLHVIIKN